MKDNYQNQNKPFGETEKKRTTEGQRDPQREKGSFGHDTRSPGSGYKQGEKGDYRTPGHGKDEGGQKHGSTQDDDKGGKGSGTYKR